MLGIQKKQKLIRYGTYELDEILPHVPEGKIKRKVKILLGERKIKVSSLRLQCFKRSLECSECGLTGSIFALETSREDITPHLNLYGIDKEGDEVLLTKDHTIPTSKGGPNNLDNLTTMCTVCNHIKGSTYEA